MATQNFFALLGDEESDDPSALIARIGAATVAAAPSKEVKKQQASAPAAKLPSKPLPPAQAVRESQSDSGRGRGGRGGRGSFAGRGSYGNREGGYNRFQGSEQGDRTSNFQGGRGGYGAGSSTLTDVPVPGDEESRQYNGGRGREGRGRGRGRGYGFSGDGEERPRQREYERKSGTGRGNEFKRDGSGRGNWGTEIDQNGAQEIVEAAALDEEKPASSEKKVEESQLESEETEQKTEEEEEKEMTLEEYEKVLSEKRKALEALKAQERKVTVDKEFESMQLIEKKNEEEIFLKLGADKGKKKETAGAYERTKKPVSINEFLKPTEGEEYFSSSGRRGRGGRGRGGFSRGGYANSREAGNAPSIEDPSQFPVLGGK